VLGTSTRFAGRDNFIRAEKGNGGSFLVRGKFSRNFLKVGFVEAHAADFHSPVRFNQKNRGYHREAVIIRNGVLGWIVEQRCKRDSVFLVERLCARRVVLRYADYRGGIVRISLGNSLQKRKRVLTDRAGDLEESNNRRTLLQHFLQRIFLAFQ